MPRVLVCLDDTPPTASQPCAQQAWIEVQTQVLPTLTVEQASSIGFSLLGMVAALAAIKLIGKAA